MSPNNPPPNHSYTDQAGHTFVWDGVQWVYNHSTLRNNNSTNNLIPLTAGPNDPPPPPTTHRAMTAQPPPVIDPALAALPHPDVHETADLHGHARAPILGGARRKGKERMDGEVPRKRKRVEGSDDEGNSRPRKRTKNPGRARGARNYTHACLDLLLDIVEEELPTGQKGWARCGELFRMRAAELGLPERSDDSLQKKYKQLIRMTKPTGDGVCPPEVERAHHIESLINEKVESRELDDSDITDHVDSDSSIKTLSSDTSDNDSDKENVDPATPRSSHHRHRQQAAKTSAPTKKTKSSTATKAPVARAVRVEQPLVPISAQAHGRTSIAADALHRISNSLVDPVVREEGRDSRTLAVTQVLSLNSQLTIVRGALADTERHMYAERSRADRAEQQLELVRMELRLQLARHRASRSRSPPRRRRDQPRHSRHSPTPESPQGQWYEATFRSGGRKRWFGDLSDGYDAFGTESSSPTIQHIKRLPAQSPDPSPARHRPRRVSAPRSSDFVQGSSSRPMVVEPRTSTSRAGPVTPRRRDHLDHVVQEDGSGSEVIPMEEDALDE